MPAFRAPPYPSPTLCPDFGADFAKERVPLQELGLRRGVYGEGARFLIPLSCTVHTTVFYTLYRGVSLDKIASFCPVLGRR